jgi:ribosomal protein S18 acetylase RimI-like enzyme
MNTVTFSVVRDLQSQEEVTAMMRMLYEEDAAPSSVDSFRFPVTVAHLLAHPAAGQIVVFEENGIVGYAILIPYWSNEFGGTILFVDELYVKPEARGRGIGHRFFEYLETAIPYEAVVLALEVSPANVRARRLYESLGFVARKHAVLIRKTGGEAG